MRRFYVRVEPPELTAEERSAAQAAGLEDKGLYSTSEGFRVGESVPEAWRDSRVFALQAEDEADASRRVARALDRHRPPGHFDVIPALPT